MAVSINHVTQAIAASSGSVSINGYKIVVVTSLPSSPDSNTIYLVTG